MFFAFYAMLAANPRGARTEESGEDRGATIVTEVNKIKIKATNKEKLIVSEENELLELPA